MKKFDPEILKKLYIPHPASHKGQNGKVLVIGGSELFHSSALWALEIASRIVDMVYFSSTLMNNEIVKGMKSKFVNGIVVPRNKVEEYIDEADAILIGPGLPRPDGQEAGDDDTKELTIRLLRKFAHKKWVIDGGSLQTINPEVLPDTAILTPHHKEFETLFGVDASLENVSEMAKKYNVTILLKGPIDIVCDINECFEIDGGNAGMTKGGTGDVLAGLTASFYCKNEAFLSTTCASFINKKAGEELYKTMGLYYNASDLSNQIPKVMKEFIL